MSWAQWGRESVDESGRVCVCGYGCVCVCIVMTKPMFKFLPLEAALYLLDLLSHCLASLLRQQRHQTLWFFPVNLIMTLL